MVTEAPARRRRGLRTAGVVVAALVRVAGVALLGASVVLGWRAWYARFGVCVGGAPPVDLPADQPQWWCTYMQDHLYDQYMPSVPWVPIDGAARLEGMSLIALGVGVAVVAVSFVGGRWFVWPLNVAGGMGLGAAWVGMGVPVWRTALAGGERVGFDDYMTASFFTVLTIFATAGMAVLSWHRGGRDGKVVAAFWAALTLAQPFPEYFLSMFLWGSHDTSPALGLLRCVLVALAGLVALVTLLPLGWRDRFLFRPLRMAGRAARRGLARLQAEDERMSPGRRW